ncbi:hypothetical protein [Methanobrevibacter sp.]|uniref:AbiTii domain-containing protein n=1 Tax=Methanobrevibacter sp. TaxID=66852 RepID=UPI0038666C34
MDSLIIDLQKDILENKDVKSILNKALMISNELELKEFNEWINLELNGYEDNLDKLPSYRVFECEVRYDAINQVGFNLVTASKIPIPSISEDIDYGLREVKVSNSILELIDICNTHQKNVHFKLDFKLEKLLKRYIKNSVDIYRVCPIFQLEAIIDHVKKEIMNWCSELKKNNILGHSFMFTEEEVETARTINNFILSNSSIQIGNNVQINNISYKNDIMINLNSIKKVLRENDIDETVYNEIHENIVIIETEIEKENPDMRLMKDTVIYVLGFISQMLSGVASGLLLQHFSTILNIISSIQLPL